MRYGYDGGMWMNGWGMVVSLLIIFIVMYFFVKFIMNNNQDNNKNDEALKILNERFARGDITEEEYKRYKKSIKK